MRFADAIAAGCHGVRRRAWADGARLELRPHRMPASGFIRLALTYVTEDDMPAAVPFYATLMAADIACDDWQPLRKYAPLEGAR